MLDTLRNVVRPKMHGERFHRSVLYSVAAICIFCGPFLYGYYFGVNVGRLPRLPLGSTKDNLNSATAAGTKDFHLLVPATSSGRDLCKLLLTGAILGYPEPIILGWDHIGVFDGAKSHLFKITQTVNYLRSLPPSAHDDLVLILDGFDIWYQLRPSVFVSRYYALLKRHDDILREQGILDKGLPETGAKIRSKLLFGADKFPGPPLFHEPYVWAAPNSTFPKDVFGPKTDKSDIDHRRPRYLNSGTMMGPVKDMLDFFEAAEDAIMVEAANKKDNDKKLEVSDQHFFGKVWGPQEIARQKLRFGEEAFKKKIPGQAIVPDKHGRRTEYGVCLDQWHELYQLVGGWKDWLTTLKFDGTEAPEVEGELGAASLSKNWTIPEEVLRSDPPYAALNETELPGHAEGWDGVVLGANAVNREPYGLLHITGDKFLREKWWPDLWFHPHAELLQKAARRKQAASEEPEVFAEVNGVRWRQTRKMFKDHEKAGAWRSSGEYLSWQTLCGDEEIEAELYRPKSTAR